MLCGKSLTWSLKTGRLHAEEVRHPSALLGKEDVVVSWQWTVAHGSAGLCRVKLCWVVRYIEGCGCAPCGECGKLESLLRLWGPVRRVATRKPPSTSAFETHAVTCSLFIDSRVCQVPVAAEVGQTKEIAWISFAVFIVLFIGAAIYVRHRRATRVRERETRE